MFQSQHDRDMANLIAALDSQDMDTMIDALLDDLNNEFITLAKLEGNQRSLERSGGRLKLISEIHKQYDRGNV